MTFQNLSRKEIDDVETYFDQNGEEIKKALSYLLERWIAGYFYKDMLQKIQNKEKKEDIRKLAINYFIK